VKLKRAGSFFPRGEVSVKVGVMEFGFYFSAV